MTETLKTSFPEWAKNLTIYEVNLRQYTSGGTFREFAEHLPRLKELGIGILWFMPVQPIGVLNRKGSLGSYYSISDYCAVDPAYGDIAEFRVLVERIHEMGMYVILDWVANHTAWDNRWVKEHPEFYRRNEHGAFHPPFPDWEDVIGLDYSCAGLRIEMTDSMRFWLREAGLDGFRCDMAHLVPTDFWEQAAASLRETNPGIYMLAETDQPDLLESAFNSSYDWRVFHAMNEAAHGKIRVADLAANIERQYKEYAPQASIMRFISNHDENSWQGSELERLGHFLEPLTVLYFTLPGIPLVYSGQEAGNPERLPFFEKARIYWKPDKMTGIISNLAGLRKSNPVLWSSRFGGGFQPLRTTLPAHIYAFARQKEDHKVVVLLNFSSHAFHFTLHDPAAAGTYFDLFDKDRAVSLGESEAFELEAYGYRVYYC